MSIFVSSIWVLSGAALNRWRGCDHPLKRYTPRPVTQMLLATPFATGAGLTWWMMAFALDWDWPCLWALGAFLTLLAIETMAFLTGPGQYFPDLNPQPLDSPQFIDPIVTAVFGADPRYFPAGGATMAESLIAIHAYGRRKLEYRCAFGMALTGLLVTLPVGIATLNPILAISGVIKAPIYNLSHRLGLGVPGGEWGTGGWYFGILIVSWWLP